MKTVHVVLHTQGLSAPDLAVFGQNIATTMAGNSNFTNVYPKAATLQSAIDDLNAAIAAARPGNKESTARLHATEAVVLRTLKAMAAHVEYESNNDETRALSSGFSVKQPSVRAAQGFEVMYGDHSGSVELKSPREAHASYIWQFTPDPVNDKEWKTAGTTMQASFAMKDLTPGSKYWFRVALVTKTGQQPWCDPLCLLIV